MMTKSHVPLLQIINPFLFPATNISIYKILMIMPLLLQIFVPYSPWHDLQQFKYSKKIWQFIFSWPALVQVASALSAQYIWKESGWKCGWERIRLVSRQAVSIASTMIFIIRTLIITVYIYYTVCTTDTATNKVFCLLYFGTQCEQSTHQIDTQKCNFQHSFILRQACRLHRNENFKLYTSRPHNSFVSRIQRKVKLSCVT